MRLMRTAHENLFLLSGEHLSKEQVLEFYKMKDNEKWPDIVPIDLESKSKEEKKN